MDGSAAQKEYRGLRVIIRAAVVDGTNDGTGRREKKLVQFFLIRLKIIYDWLGFLAFLNVDIGGAGGADDTQCLYFRVHENIGFDICFQRLRDAPVFCGIRRYLGQFQYIIHAGNIGGYLEQDTFVIRQHVIDAVLGQLQVICQEGVVFSKQHFGSLFIVKKLNADDREKGHKEQENGNLVSYFI